MRLIEHLTKVQVDGSFVQGEKVNNNFFGGFCSCGGIMYQKLWFKTNGSSMVISECEKCWRNEAMEFNGKKFISREEVEVVDRVDFKNLLKDYLSNSEYSALDSKWNNEEYNYGAFSRAKKKLEEMGLNLEDVITYI